MPTVRCTSCSEWHHRPCVISFNVEPLTFVCERCQVSLNGVTCNCSGSKHPLFFSLFLKKRTREQVGPSQQTHPPNATPFPAPIYPDDPSVSISGMPTSGALALSFGLGEIGSLSSGTSSSRIPLYHPTMSADDDFILGPPPPPPPGSSFSHQRHGHAAPSTTRGNTRIPTMAEALYGSNLFHSPLCIPLQRVRASLGVWRRIRVKIVWGR
jgi:hypothetical protein